MTPVVTISITPRDRYTGLDECGDSVYRYTREPFRLWIMDLDYPQADIAPVRKRLHGQPEARFFSLVVFARGLLDKLHTRIYLPEDTQAHAADPLLSSLSEDERRTLIATREADGSLRSDIRLQGEGETVFLDYWGK